MSDAMNGVTFKWVAGVAGTIVGIVVIPVALSYISRQHIAELKLSALESQVIQFQQTQLTWNARVETKIDRMLQRMETK